jgi:hypothetical protein
MMGLRAATIGSEKHEALVMHGRGERQGARHAQGASYCFQASRALASRA